MRRMFRICAALTGAVASFLVSRSASAEWIMGTDAVAPGGSYFTFVVSVFTVPSPPTSGTTNAISAFWPGLEDQDGDLVQSVLVYNQAQTPGWTMHNEVALLNGSGTIDNATPVSTGDVITAQVNIDVNDPGPSCNMVTGANCNYLAVWDDETSGASGVLSTDHMMREGPAYALGMVFELPGFVFNSCADLPVGSIAYQTFLFVGNSSGIDNEFSPTFTAETPGSTFPFNFSNQALNDGGNVYPSCASITYPYEGSTQKGLFQLH